MNFLQILADIEQVDPEVYDRLDSRRAIFKNMAGLGQKLSAAALPLAIGAIFNKAYAQTPVGAGVTDVLNFALRLEYLESYFYNLATTVTGLSSANQAALALIRTDEANHVTFLRATITALGGTPITVPATTGVFDFTARGRFTPTEPNTYLALAQSLEDTGVRAYKGAAPLVMSNKTVLTAALSIHGVEARHAARIRTMRRGGISSSTPAQGVAVAPYSAAPKSWISGTDNGGAVSGFTNAIYGAGNQTNAPANVTFLAEDNILQGGVTLSGTNLPNTAGFPASAFSEAFDEGLDVGTVAAIANNFSVTGTYFN
jgi:hypothetical protein